MTCTVGSIAHQSRLAHESESLMRPVRQVRLGSVQNGSVRFGSYIQVPNIFKILNIFK